MININDKKRLFLKKQLHRIFEGGKLMMKEVLRMLLQLKKHKWGQIQDQYMKMMI